MQSQSVQITEVLLDSEREHMPLTLQGGLFHLPIKPITYSAAMQPKNSLKRDCHTCTEKVTSKHKKLEFH